MPLRPQFVCVSLILGVLLTGCGSKAAEAEKKATDDYHSHVAGPKPPAGAIHGGPPANMGGPGKTN